MLAEMFSDKETVLIRHNDRGYIGFLPSIEYLPNHCHWIGTDDPLTIKVNHQSTIDAVFETLKKLDQLT
jgi:hypothetical protein